LEAQLIDLADEIAYDTADLDDGMEAKLLSLESLRRKLPLFEDFFEPVRRKYPAAPPKLQFNEALKAILNYFVTDLMETSLARVEELALASSDAVRSHPTRLIGFSPAVEPHTRQLRKYLYENLYHHPALASEKEMGSEMIGQLFDLYMRDPERLPRTYAERARRSPPHQVVCDYIAGMTDPYITKLHEELVGKLPPVEPSPVMNGQARQS
jgi:dGTPase